MIYIRSQDKQSLINVAATAKIFITPVHNEDKDVRKKLTLKANPNTLIVEDFDEETDKVLFTNFKQGEAFIVRDIKGYDYVFSDNLGTYSSKEKATEVLNKIQALIHTKHETKQKHSKNYKAVGLIEPLVDINQNQPTGDIVFQMPEDN